MLSRRTVRLDQHCAFPEENDAPCIPTLMQGKADHREMQFVRQCAGTAQLLIPDSVRTVFSPYLFGIFVDLIPTENRNQVLVQFPFAFVFRLALQQTDAPKLAFLFIILAVYLVFMK